MEASIKLEQQAKKQLENEEEVERLNAHSRQRVAHNKEATAGTTAEPGGIREPQTKRRRSRRSAAGRKKEMEENIVREWAKNSPASHQRGPSLETQERRVGVDEEGERQSDEDSHDNNLDRHVAEDGRYSDSDFCVEILSSDDKESDPDFVESAEEKIPRASKKARRRQQQKPERAEGPSRKGAVSDTPSVSVALITV